jgi:hypothetical protein
MYIPSIMVMTAKRVAAEIAAIAGTPRWLMMAGPIGVSFGLQDEIVQSVNSSISFEQFET